MSLYLLFNLQRCWFPKHHSSNIYYPHCFLCFGCQAMGCWWKKMHKSCDNYRFILWSFIVIMPVITSALLSTSQMSQSYSLTYYSLLFDTSNHPPFFCPHSCENITAYVTNWILLKKKTKLKFLDLQLIILSSFCSGSLDISPLLCEQLGGSHHDLFTLVSLMPN